MFDISTHITLQIISCSEISATPPGKLGLMLRIFRVFTKSMNSPNAIDCVTDPRTPLCHSSCPAPGFPPQCSHSLTPSKPSHMNPETAHARAESICKQCCCQGMPGWHLPTLFLGELRSQETRKEAFLNIWELGKTTSQLFCLL